MAEKLFAIEIITPEKVKFKGSARSITLSTPDGEISVLADHAPLTTLIVSGELILKTEFKTMHFAIGDGFLQVNKNKAALLVDFAEKAEEIDYEEVLKEKQKIEQELMSAHEKQDLSVENLKVKLQQEIVRLKVVSKKI